MWWHWVLFVLCIISLLYISFKDLFLYNPYYKKGDKDVDL